MAGVLRQPKAEPAAQARAAQVSRLAPASSLALQIFGHAVGH
jgi:hypothetical protein